MALKVSIEDVEPEQNGGSRTWRLFKREDSHGVGIGIAEFNPVATTGSGPVESHDVPEAHYVLSGRGVLVENGERIPLEAGDAVITLPGVEHVLYSVGEKPLVTVYVAIDSSKTAAQMAPNASANTTERPDRADS